MSEHSLRYIDNDSFFTRIDALSKLIWVILVNAGFAVFFLAQGAFPVAGFLGLDVLALWLAFHFNYRAARRIANSMLVKTALFGGDANWGRILQTIGHGRVALDLARTEVCLGGVPVFRRGASAGTAARNRAQKKLQAAEVMVEVRLGAGAGQAEIWTCDLSYDYVKINAEYRT